MNDLSLVEMARSQGPFFWGAVAAIALGITFLLVASVLALRARIRRGRRLAAPLRERSTGVQQPASATPLATAIGTDVATAYEPTRRPSNGALATPSAAMMLRRLQAAGDRLEEFADEIGNDRAKDSLYTLKSDLQDVEYVFRASGS